MIATNFVASSESNLTRDGSLILNGFLSIVKPKQVEHLLLHHGKGFLSDLSHNFQPCVCIYVIEIF